MVRSIDLDPSPGAAPIMDISEDTERWLRTAGYQYYCFISYPKIHGDMGKFAARVKDAIQNQLAATVHNPQVFLDSMDIPRGSDWERMVSRSLCGSVVMVALCLSAYYRSAHRWCGLEWAAMEKLGSRRLSGHALRPIVPIMLRAERPVPEAVLTTQYVDMTAASLTWEKYCATLGFKKSIRQIVDYIGDVAEAIAINRVAAENCPDFLVSGESAFADWRPIRQEFPLHVRQ